MGALALVGILCFGMPLSLFASSPTQEHKTPTKVYSKTVTVSKVYTIYEHIPGSIYYNKAGYSGTLYIDQQQRAGDLVLVVYKGTVSCTAPCPM